MEAVIVQEADQSNAAKSKLREEDKFNKDAVTDEYDIEAKLIEVNKFEADPAEKQGKAKFSNHVGEPQQNLV